MSDGSTSIAEVSDDVLMDAQTGASQRLTYAGLASKRFEKVAADNPERVDLAACGGPDHRACGQSRTLRYGESPELSPSIARRRVDAWARSPLPRRPAHRSVRVSASGRDVERRTRPRASARFTSAWIVRTPCACCVSPIDHTKMVFGLSRSKSGESLDIATARAALCLDVAPGRRPHGVQDRGESLGVCRDESRRRSRLSRRAPSGRRRETRGRRLYGRGTNGSRASCRRARSRRPTGSSTVRGRVPAAD